MGKKLAKIAIIVRLQEGGGQEDVGKETVETTEKEGKQDTVDTPLTSPSDDVMVQVKKNTRRFFSSNDSRSSTNF